MLSGIDVKLKGNDKSFCVSLLRVRNSQKKKEMTKHVRYNNMEFVRRECLHAVQVSRTLLKYDFTDITSLVSCANVEKPFALYMVEWLIIMLYISYSYLLLTSFLQQHRSVHLQQMDTLSFYQF